MAVAITKKPTPAPKNLKLARATENGNASIKATWGYPADAGYDTNRGRWTASDEYWEFNASKNMTAKGKYTQQRGSAHVTADRVWVRDKGKHESSTMWYNRSKYHPQTSGRYLKSVTAAIAAYNAKGQTRTTATFTFKVPRAPTISTGTYDPETSKVTFQVKTNAGTDAYERYDTEIWLYMKCSSGAPMDDKYKKGFVLYRTLTTTSTDYALSVDVNVAMAIAPGQWVQLRAQARSRGLAGNSATVTRDYYHAFPAQATISKVSTSKKDAGGTVTILCKSNSSTTAPVDEMVLQRLANTPLATANATAASDEWEEVEGAVDNGNATGFSDSNALAMPAVRNHTWYRIRTAHGSLVRYSQPVEATCLYTAREPGGNITFASFVPGADGTSVRMVLGWPNDSYTATRVAWSDHADAWESNDGPDTFDIDWEDDSSQVSGKAHSAAFTLRGLKEGVPIYVRARRVAEVDGVESRSGWCDPPDTWFPIQPVPQPPEVTLTAPTSVVRGDGIPLWWALGGDAQQVAWSVSEASTSRVLASGEGPDGACTIPASAVGERQSISVRVSVTCGGVWATSEAASVSVLDAPALAVMLPQITAQPVTIALECSEPTSTVVASLSAATMVSGSTPAGTRTVAEGDVVWSDAWLPAWVEDDTVGSLGWVATYELPEGLDLVEGAPYVLAATATAQGVPGAEATATADVAWAHQAVPPGDGTTLVVDGEALSVAITPEAPEDALPTDVCDIWRVTTDGPYLVAEGVAFGEEVIDGFAPYSAGEGAGLAYRLVTRTADGDADWRDFEYELSHSALRFDWSGGSVELPYNISTQDARKKPFELSERWDGSRPGGWDAGHTRTSSLTSELVAVDSWDERRALAQLGAYDGPVLVRTPNGQCFCADAEVTGHGDAYNTSASAVSISLTECDMADEFRMTMPETTAEEDGGGE